MKRTQKILLIVAEYHAFNCIYSSKTWKRASCKQILPEKWTKTCGHVENCAQYHKKLQEKEF